MSLEAFGVQYAALKGPEWILVGVAIAAIAVVFWEGWEKKMGNVRPALSLAVGILLSFLAGMSVERGVGNFRSHASNHRWVVEVLLGLVSLVMAFIYIVQRNEKPQPSWGSVEWFYKRNKPPSMFDKKDD